MTQSAEHQHSPLTWRSRQRACSLTLSTDQEHQLTATSADRRHSPTTEP